MVEIDDYKVFSKQQINYIQDSGFKVSSTKTFYD